LNPLQPDKLIEMFCEEYNLEVSKVKPLIEEYFKQVKKEVSSLNYNRVRIDGIGTLELRQPKVQIRIKKLEKALGLIPPTSFTNYAKYAKIDELKKKLEDRDAEFNKEKKEKLEHKERRWKKS